MFRSIIVRTILPLLLAAGTVAYFGLPYIDRLLAQWFRSDVELRAQLLMSSMQEVLPVYLAKNDQAGLRRYVARITADQRLLGLLICRPDGTPLIKSERMPAAVDCQQVESVPDGRSGVLETPTGSVQVSVFDQSPPGMTPYRVGHRLRPELHRSPSEHGARLRDRFCGRLGAACWRCSWCWRAGCCCGAGPTC